MWEETNFVLFPPHACIVQCPPAFGLARGDFDHLTTSVSPSLYSIAVSAA